MSGAGIIRSCGGAIGAPQGAPQGTPQAPGGDGAAPQPGCIRHAVRLSRRRRRRAWILRRRVGAAPLLCGAQGGGVEHDRDEKNEELHLCSSVKERPQRRKANQRNQRKKDICKEREKESLESGNGPPARGEKEDLSSSRIFSCGAPVPPQLYTGQCAPFLFPLFFFGRVATGLGQR